MNEQKYFIIVRLFKGWRDQITLYQPCVRIYWSMRVEVENMNSVLDTDEDFIKWNLLHQGYPFDTLQNAPLNELLEELPFEILIKKNLTRTEMLDIRSRLHTAIYSDEITDDELSEDNYLPTYSEWMSKFKEVLEEFDTINVPNPDFDFTHPEII